MSQIKNQLVMKKIVLAMSFASLLGCTKVDYEFYPVDRDLFYRVLAYDDNGTIIETSPVAATRASVDSLTGEILGTDAPPGNGGAGGNGQDHYNGDGCNENTPRFCEKHPWHKKCSTLPVRIQALNLQKNSGYIVIAWQSADETGLVKYSVERSTDAKTFTSIGTVKPRGVNITYTFKDNGL